jgi:ferredoxin
MLFKKILNFEEIKRWFDPDRWDIGYITKEQLRICSQTPTKAQLQWAKGWNFSNDIHFNWMGICNGIVLIKKSFVSLDYLLYEEASEILMNQGLKEFSDWAHVYTNFKQAEILSGRGVRARNSLVYNYKFGFDSKVCVIGFKGMIQNPPKIKRVAGNNFKEEFWHNCIGCDACREVCPVGAIHNNEDINWLDSGACDDFLGLSDHPRIPSMKKFWHENVRPDIPKEIVDKVKTTPEMAEASNQGIPFMDWNANGYSDEGGVFYKDGKQISVPICRECQVQAPCSDWGGKYLYEEENSNIVSNYA